MTDNLSRAWWLLALRGVIGIAFGIVAFLWTGITLLALIALFGAYMFVDGVFAIAAAIRLRHEGERWPMLLLEGVLGIAIGVLTFFWPGITALAWVYTIAAWAILTGVLEIVLAVRLRKVIQGEFWIGLTGVASIVLGVAMAVLPLAGLVAWVWMIGAYSIAFGVLLIAAALRLRNAGSATPTGLSAAGT